MPANGRPVLAIVLVLFLIVAVVVGLMLAGSLSGPPTTQLKGKGTTKAGSDEGERLKMGPGMGTPSSGPGWLNPDDPLAGLDSPDATTRRYALDQTLIGNWIQGYSVSRAATREQKAAAATRLRQAFKDDSPEVRLAAAELIERIGSSLGMKPEEAVPVCEALIAESSTETRTRAAIIVWRYKGTPEAGKVLVAGVENKQLTQSYRLWSAAGTNAKPHRYPDGMVPALERVVADRREDRFTRTFFLERMKYALDTDVSASDTFRERFVGLVSDQTEDTEVRQAVLGFLAQLKDRTAFDALRPMVVRMAADPKTAVPLRVRLIGSLSPRAESFATDHPEVAKQLTAAVSDPKQDPAFRAFAAHFFTPDTEERFDDALRLMADTNPSTITLRRVLAERMMAEHARKPWTTDTPFPNSRLRLMALCPSRHLSPRVESGYADSGEPWQQVPANTPGADLDTAFVKEMLRGEPQLLTAVIEGLEKDLTRRRNLEALLKWPPNGFWDHDIIAVRIAAVDLSGDEQKLATQVVGRSLNGSSLGDWLRASKPARERLPELVKEWKAARKDPVPLLVGLFTHERYEVRERAAAEIGKIGPDAKGAIPKLAERLVSDTHSAEPYVAALAAIGPDSLPALSDLMRHKEPRVRTAAADAIGRLGPEVRSKATPVLRAVIEQEKDAAVKAAALNALGRVNADAAKQLGWDGR